MKKISKYGLELRVRFEQSRADALAREEAAMTLRLRELEARLYALHNKAHARSERAAALRGHLGAMIERGCDTMRVVGGLCEFTKEGN